MILTDIGEVGVHVGDDVYVLRPSLYAMTRIGPPAYIVEVYATVMAEGIKDHRARAIQFWCAHEVLQACTEQDISHLIGQEVHNEATGGLTYEPGLIPQNEILLLAKCLMRHGVTGSVEPLPKDEDDDADDDDSYVSQFDARKHVANAIAHLGMSEKEAWQITMTALVDSLRAKFPPVPKDGKEKQGKPPSAAEYDNLMEIADRIEAKRKLRLGIKD